MTVDLLTRGLLVGTQIGAAGWKKLAYSKKYAINIYNWRGEAATSCDERALATDLEPNHN